MPGTKPTFSAPAGAQPVQYVLSNGGVDHAIPAGHATYIRAMGGERFRFHKVGPGGRQPLHNILVVARGTDGDLTLITDDGISIVIAGFYHVVGASIELDTADPTVLDAASPALSHAVDGSALVFAEGDGLSSIALGAADTYGVLETGHLANVLAWSPTHDAGVSGISHSFVAIGAGVIGGLAAVAASIASSGGSHSAAASQAAANQATGSTSPVIHVNAIAGDGRVNAAESAAGITISGTTANVEDGQILTVDWGGKTKSSVVTSGSWSTAFAAADMPGDGAAIPITVTVTDKAGTSNTQSATLPKDTVDPILTMTVAGDNAISASEYAAGFTITGTATVEAGRIVTVNFNSKAYTAAVDDGAWHLDVPHADLTGAQASNYAVIATVYDLAQNETTILQTVLKV